MTQAAEEPLCVYQLDNLQREQAFEHTVAPSALVQSRTIEQITFVLLRFTQHERSTRKEKKKKKKRWMKIASKDA
jgi:hypothetical protein